MFRQPLYIKQPLLHGILSRDFFAKVNYEAALITFYIIFKICISDT